MCAGDGGGGGGGDNNSYSCHGYTLIYGVQINLVTRYPWFWCLLYQRHCIRRFAAGTAVFQNAIFHR